MERSTRIASWSTSFCFLKKNGNVKGLSELTSYTGLYRTTQMALEHPWIHDYFGAEMIDTYWLTPSGTWFLRSLVRFFLLRFSLFASDEMQLSDCSTWHLVCWLALLPKLVPGPRRVPGQRHWSLFRVHFFRYWACPTLRSFSQLLFLWARPHQRPHLLPLLQSQPVNCYVMLF